MAREHVAVLLHASTQKGIHTLAGVAWAACHGVSRVILAQELRWILAELASIQRTTRLELEVFVHLAHGLSVKQCADRMELSPSTVDNHKSRLMKKLNIHKLVDLALLAFREGLVD